MGVLRKIVIGLIPFAVEMGVKKTQAPKNIALKAIGGMLIAAAAIFGSIALHQYLSLYFEAVKVNLMFAGGFLILALLCFLTAAVRAKKSERSRGMFSIGGLSSFQENLKDTAQHTAANISRIRSDVKHNLRDNAGKYMLAAAVIGLILGARTRGKKKPPKS